jgi:hypothetical protein
VDQQLALIALAPKEPEKQLIRASMGAELAEFLSKLGRHREAIDLGRTYLQEVQKFVGPGHASFSLAARTLAGLLLTEGKALDEAGSLLSAASRDPATENVMACAALMAQVRLKQGKPADAVTCCEQLVGDLGRLAADTAVPVQAAVENLLEVYADALSSAGRGDDAIANYQVSIARIGRRLGDHSPYLVSPLQKLARACHARGVQDEAARAERRANSISRLVRGSQSPVR